MFYKYVLIGRGLSKGCVLVVQFIVPIILTAIILLGFMERGVTDGIALFILGAVLFVALSFVQTYLVGLVVNKIQKGDKQID